MRATVPLVQLALWTSCTSAFYPYMPMWLKEIEDRDPGSEAKRNAVDDGAVTFDLKQRVEDVCAINTFLLLHE